MLFCAICTPSFRVSSRKEERINVIIIEKRLQIISERLVGPNLINNILVQPVSDSSHGRKKSRKKR